MSSLGFSFLVSKMTGLGLIFSKELSSFVNLGQEPIYIPTWTELCRSNIRNLLHWIAFSVSCVKFNDFLQSTFSGLCVHCEFSISGNGSF